MKKKIWLAVGALFLAFLIAGAVFCVLRPEYVREAVSILFENELPY